MTFYVFLSCCTCFLEHCSKATYSWKVTPSRPVYIELWLSGWLRPSRGRVWSWWFSAASWSRQCLAVAAAAAVIYILTRPTHYCTGVSRRTSSTACKARLGGAAIFKVGGDKTWWRSFFAAPTSSNVGVREFEQGNNYHYWIRWNLLSDCRVNNTRIHTTEITAWSDHLSVFITLISSLHIINKSIP